MQGQHGRRKEEGKKTEEKPGQSQSAVCPPLIGFRYHVGSRDSLSLMDEHQNMHSSLLIRRAALSRYTQLSGRQSDVSRRRGPVGIVSIFPPGLFFLRSSLGALRLCPRGPVGRARARSAFFVLFRAAPLVSLGKLPLSHLFLSESSASVTRFLSHSYLLGSFIRCSK